MTRQPIVLIALQQLFSGIALVTLYTAANALFLAEFERDAITYSFIAIGILGASVTIGFRILQKVWSLQRLTLLVYLATAAFIIIGRIMLTLPTQTWITFLLVVSYTIIYSLITIIVGLQAARVFEGWQFRSMYPLVMASQIAGVILAGGLISPILTFINGVENLLWVSASGIILSLVVMLIHMRLFKDRYESQVDQQTKEKPGKSPQTPFIRMIYTYIFVSYCGSRLVTFLGLAAIEQRFELSDEIATFFGNLAAVLTLLTLMFLLTASGYLMRRMGLRLGLTANPVTVFIGISFALVVSGQEDTFFWALIVAYGLDFVFTAGMTDTSIRSVYRALPDSQRFAVETTVMGIIYPLSFGVTGVSVMLFGLISNISLFHVVVFTFGITIAWITVALRLYKVYREIIEKDAALYQKLATNEMRHVTEND